jgi:hypothetical protein
MSDERPKRPRIPFKAAMMAKPIIADELEFTKNMCSPNARKIKTQVQETIAAIWFDKHYHDRSQHGDENGKRDGIDPVIVEKLVIKAIPHLLLFSSIVPGFVFLNHSSGIGTPSTTPVRIVLKERTSSDVLNVVIEAHYIDITEFEITVKTAMCVADFRLSDGQYLIDFEGDTVAVSKRQRGIVMEILAL